MPQSKNASFRYRVIDEVLRNRRTGVDFHKLLEIVSEQMNEAFGRYRQISESTLRKDISLMKKEPPYGYGAPIKCRDGKYFYDDPDFSIHKKPLSQSDLNIIRKASELMRSVSGMPMGHLLENLLSRFESTEVHNSAGPLILSDYSSNVEGLDHIDKLLDALLNRYKIRFNYVPFKNTSFVGLIVDPWLLKEFNGRWFLIGKSSHREGVSVFALDRMTMLDVFKDKRAIDPDYTLLARYKDVIGLSFPDDGKREEIILRFDKERYKYVKSKPIHKSQKLIGDDATHCLISLQLVVNKELISLIHYFGPDVEVLAPAHLRATIARHINQLKERYDKQ
ncbi:MAG: WYL domain-containing protein [Bacteroidetes bacterium]|nr:WYL domain-containing protein [Bacteroidota bacterium]